MDERHPALSAGREPFRSARWAQDVTANVEEPGRAPPRWIISGLGDLSVEGDVTGPLYEPMDRVRRQTLDDRRRDREHDLDEFWTTLQTVKRNFLTAVSAG